MAILDEDLAGFLWNEGDCSPEMAYQLLSHYTQRWKPVMGDMESPARQSLLKTIDLLLTKPELYESERNMYSYSGVSRTQIKLLTLLTKTILALGRMDLLARLALSLNSAWPHQASRSVEKALLIFGFDVVGQG